MQAAIRTSVALFALASVALAGPPPKEEDSTVAAVESSPASASAPESQWEGMSMDALIDALPPVGGEWRWDRAAGEGVEHPASVEMERRLRAGAVLTDGQWRTVLRRTGAVKVRTTWPASEPFAVSMDVPRWLGITQIRVKVSSFPERTAKAGELYWSVSGTMPMIRAREARFQRLGELELGRHPMKVDIVVERGESSPLEGDAPPPAVLWEGTIEYDVEVVDSVDDAIPAVSDADLDRAVRHALGAGFRSWGSGETAYVVIDPDVSAHPVLAHTGLSLAVEAIRDGEIVETGVVVAGRLDRLALANSVSLDPLRFYGSCNLSKVPLGLASDPAELARWSLRVRGTGEYALYVWEATQRWGGELTIPLADAIRNERERTGPGGRGPEISTPRPR